MTEYVVGFMFSRDLSRVALIRKNRPEWQKGKFNGIGGHIKSQEIPIEAMVREFKEETGVVTTKDQWLYSVKTSGEDWKVHTFCTTGDLASLSSITDEKLVIVEVSVVDVFELVGGVLTMIDMSLAELEGSPPDSGVNSWLKEKIQEVKNTAIKNGWYENGGPDIGTRLMLIVSELSEALEADRNSNTCTRKKWDSFQDHKDKKWVEDFEEEVKDTFEDEIADVFIRLFDLCGHLEIPIDKFIEAKIAYNKTRDYKHGGKKY